MHRARNSNSKNAAKKAQREQGVHDLYGDYVSLAKEMISKSEVALDALARHDCAARIAQIVHYIKHAQRKIDQIERRVLKGGSIPHEEKVFSLFEEHTEWLSKGKAGVHVCILEDQYQFVLHHRIMWKESDDKVAVAMVEAAQQRYPDLRQCSFDKGFYTPANLTNLNQCLECVILPKKDRLNKDEQAREQDEKFRAARGGRIVYQ